MSLRTLKSVRESIDDQINWSTGQRELVGVQKELRILRTHLQDVAKRRIKFLDAIDKGVKSKVQECVDFAQESPYPETQQLYDMVYEQEDYPFIKHRY